MDKRLYRVDRDLVPRVEKEFDEVKDDGEMAGQSGVCVFKLYHAKLAEENDTSFFIILSDGVHFYQSLPNGFDWLRVE